MLHQGQPHRVASPFPILNLLAESRPEENEVQSEAAFQRLISSCSDLPTQPRTPRAPSDRGRYPEEAGDEDAQREDTPSDDEDGDVGGLFAFEAQSEATSIFKPCTPAHSISGEDLNMSLTGSPVVGAMDVDMPLPSPSMISTPASIQWRYTPPPTTSAVRSTKRKFDDRFDPYPTASQTSRQSHPSFVPRTPNNISRLPIPIAIPVSSVSSAASSPTVTYSCPAMPGSRPVSLGTMSVTSSPIMRPTLGLASPVLRPILRSRRGLDGEEREIEGAGEAVNGLSLG
ncbi:hypothetical protein SERLADRAFT_455089 [Serpula lacrymans var. lacrymans S7.9]|uniref:Uncharacterized protein n=1 Tax=Serpula lacrymans var. lacrymans (strain S7.9) TaxID=578457 RepID=F8NF89_SERL9|nr:uncharacterized protein SERLADRAFT_455089 [Serpula lacrymans var. lacrymans S7.9]EGO30803.1 hypothetical protein SERLADRAFT_455089 [Serpula lacrymans var. lacrymans S7.9]